jgi:cytochrome c biogenesis DsbD-like protein
MLLRYKHFAALRLFFRQTPKAGLGLLWVTLPRAALRFTTFRYPCPGLNSSARYAGSLNSLCLHLLFLGAVFASFLFCAACHKSSPVNQPRQTAASPGAPKIRSSADVVKVTPQSMSIPTGGNADASVTISISSGYHVNANPATFNYLIATELTPQQAQGLTAGKPVYPSAEKRKFQFADQPLAVYEGDAHIKLPLHAAANAAKGIRPLPITLRVQACDNEKCYPPATLNSYISVEVK